MCDQRVEARAVLGGEDGGDGAGVGRVGAKAVDGLGRKGDQCARTQQYRRPREAGGVRCEALGPAHPARGPGRRPVAKKKGFSQPGLP